MLSISSTNIVTRAMPYYPGLTLTLMKFMVRIYTSTTAINLAPYKTFDMMLEQINTETNKYNGVLSMILDVIDVETSNFREIVTIIQEFPCSKLLRNSMINELKVSIADEYGKAINNNDQQINIVIQIIKHEHLWGGHNCNHRC